MIDVPGGTDGSGWPPVTAERVWAKHLQGDRFEIDNVPFFAKGISLGDIVTARIDESAGDSALRVREIALRGGHSTYRVIVLPGLDPDRHNAYHQLLTVLHELGAKVEVGGTMFFAVDVPPSVDCSAIYDLLQVGEQERIWDFEEGDYQMGRHTGKR